MKFILYISVFVVCFASSASAESLNNACHGVLKQGGLLSCYGVPGTVFEHNGQSQKTGKDGRALIGFDRDADANGQITITQPNGEVSSMVYKLEKRDYAISRIDGLPPSQVSSFTDEQLARIRASSARKKIGFASRVEQVGFVDGFDYPIKDFRKTSPFGAQRILNGEPKRPHYGIDMAAPEGTAIYAPADGIVALADDDLYFEGAMVMIDHGQGLNSMYLHVSEIYVEAGQSVKKGEKIAAVGSKGRSTAPHLCWRLKWRDRNLDPELLTEWPGSP